MQAGTHSAILCKLGNGRIYIYGGCGLSADQLQEVLKAVKEGMCDEVASLKRELASNREASDECLLKKLKLEKAPSFKRRLTKSNIFSTRKYLLKWKRRQQPCLRLPLPWKRQRPKV